MTILEKANQILADKEANLLPENLRNGTECLGVKGTLIELAGEEKAVIATTEEQEITPGEGFNGITKVIVRPVTNAIDANIKAENIKIGATILGIEGSYEGEILVYNSLTELPAVATVGNLAIVETLDKYENSNESTIFDEIHFPEQVVFENTLTDLAGYIGVKPQDIEIPIVETSGSLDANMYTFKLKINDGESDTLDVTYLSDDGITYTRDNVDANGVFRYDDETGILTSEIELVPYADESLGENMYNDIGGKFLQVVVKGGFAGVYQFGETGWVRIDTDTSGTSATAEDIAYGKTAYVNGELIEGTLLEAVQFGGSGNGSVSMYEDSIGISEKLDQKLIGNAGADILAITSFATLAEAIGLTADKIKAGETILGITGTYTGETTDEGGATGPSIGLDDGEAGEE